MDLGLFFNLFLFRRMVPITKKHLLLGTCLGNMDAVDTVPIESQELMESAASFSMHGQIFEIEESPQRGKNKEKNQTIFCTYTMCFK